MKLGLKKDEITNGKYGQPTLQRDHLHDGEDKGKA